MYCSQELLFLRAKNLITLFPRHIHILNKYDMSSDQKNKFSLKASFFGLIVESPTEYKCYPPEVNTDNFPSLNYGHVVFIESNFKECVNINSQMFCVRDSANPFIWQQCTDVNNTIPKLQCDIFNAIYGPNWVDMVTLTIEKRLVPESHN